MAEIVLDKVTKLYPDGAAAVSDVDITIADGEFIILVGPSGCGKSTTLNMIAGLEDISSGELRIAGERVNERAPKDRDIAMVFQSYALYPHMTVRDNIAFPLTLAKMSKEDIAKKVDDAARILDLGQHLDRKPSNLSGGQRQRVAMGRAIVRSPKAFLMDEPLSNLDAKLRVQMRTEIAQLQKRLETTTVYVTHDQTEAMTLGDRVVVLRGGLVQQIGSPQELYDHPRNLFVAGFIGSPSMNFVSGRLTEGGVTTSLGEIRLSDEARQKIASKNAKGDVVVGIRPEHLEDASLVESYQKINGSTFSARVEVLESMGSDKYIYFSAEGPKVTSRELDELAADSGADGGQLVARLSAESAARMGESIELWFDQKRVSVFDVESGANLTL
ncbi:sn-glycerol-3-phosphate ABC transporter ATP-binding protein UgpC [Rhodococcus sp. BP-349]|uniref:Multiple sugar transport system ATP-binding protein n=1 Tax=Rhodococcoides corynebacterioides TaxID=53972 RepID=A0ABS2KQ03_9NOCA|nr:MULTISPECIES: sn-glycerol-3-phosphate ABC transporter ATP-binding protein UgpC [Rhodococcus]MBM7414054.1 multiple sugar transport system ATP-binding protein [Rhodococcus corynebacterioides]MBP1116517.1 multiple sugar transport system ATP-binding protein [Rhodococcus sp. PvP016]MBY6538679.1 sn-glycerol-3-phosphate ABC transporter ATP-binding protein UgpC [Rhodococcus sp. BP-363]MBY6543016.1 sn-glycerol-3-phosphate ABC transporter ATP-binding protein UgpC [Rhodococcus sp. BP-369]MBY6562246.1 